MQGKLTCGISDATMVLGLCMGSGAVFSIRYGRRDEEGLRESISASFVLIGGLTILLNVIAFLTLDGIRIFLRALGNSVVPLFLLFPLY